MITLTELREDEVRYRRRGHFEAANRVRQAADEWEQTGAFPRACSYLDRGSVRPLSGAVGDGLAFVDIDNGTCCAFTPDLAVELVRGLACWLCPDIPPEPTAETMRALAKRLIDMAGAAETGAVSP